MLILVDMGWLRARVTAEEIDCKFYRTFDWSRLRLLSDSANRPRRFFGQPLPDSSARGRPKNNPAPAQRSLYWRVPVKRQKPNINLDPKSYLNKSKQFDELNAFLFQSVYRQRNDLRSLIERAAIIPARYSKQQNARIVCAQSPKNPSTKCMSPLTQLQSKRICWETSNQPSVWHVLFGGETRENLILFFCCYRKSSVRHWLFLHLSPNKRPIGINFRAVRCGLW